MLILRIGELRLSKYFGTSQGFWLGLQADHDMDVAREKIESELETIRRNEKVEEIYRNTA